MPSTIINMHMRGPGLTSSFGVDPTMPEGLRASGLQEMQWNTFCDSVNKRLEHLNIKLMIANSCCLIGLLVIVLTSVEILTKLHFIFQTLFLWICFRPLLVHQTYKDIFHVCVEASNDQSLVSYHLRSDLYGGNGTKIYIDVPGVVW